MPPDGEQRLKQFLFGPEVFLLEPSACGRGPRCGHALERVTSPDVKRLLEARERTCGVTPAECLLARAAQAGEPADVHLLGPRGAGVTVVTDDVPAGRVLLELLSGERRPSTGRVRVDGHYPAANPALEIRIRAASIRDGAVAIRQFAIDRGVDVWLLDATSALAMGLEPVLHLLRRAGAPGNPTVVVVVDPTEVPETGRVLHLRHGRLAQASPASEPEIGPRPPTHVRPQQRRNKIMVGLDVVRLMGTAARTRCGRTAATRPTRWARSGPRGQPLGPGTRGSTGP